MPMTAKEFQQSGESGVYSPEHNLFFLDGEPIPPVAKPPKPAATAKPKPSEAEPVPSTDKSELTDKGDKNGK